MAYVGTSKIKRSGYGYGAVPNGCNRVTDFQRNKKGLGIRVTLGVTVSVRVLFFRDSLSVLLRAQHYSMLTVRYRNNKNIQNYKQTTSTEHISLSDNRKMLSNRKIYC